jgi:hypothetical protein
VRNAAAVGLGKYIKKAFLNRWNLLALLGGMGFALLSGHPDVAIPLVLAGETAFLGFVGANPRFQHSVDSEERKSARAQADADAVARMMSGLPRDQLRRFQALRDRCINLRQIAEGMRGSTGTDSIGPLDELQLSDLDRLLWMYLRMLYTQHMLEQFLENTSADQIQAEIRRLQTRLGRLEKDPDSAKTTRMRQSLQANLETCQSRLANLEKARENHELLQAEIGNLEAKIQSITELAINRSDADALSGQVEQITQSLARTEQTINDLGFATGVESFDMSVPNLLPRDVAGPTELGQEPPVPRRQRENEIRYQ